MITLAAKPRRKLPKQLCPVPGCKNTAAPAFGMVCAEHRNVAKTKIKKYREARRAEKLGTKAKPSPGKRKAKAKTKPGRKAARGTTKAVKKPSKNAAAPKTVSRRKPKKRRASKAVASKAVPAAPAGPPPAAAPAA